MKNVGCVRTVAGCTGVALDAALPPTPKAARRTVTKGRIDITQNPGRGRG
jgi:hypothetical protein